MTELVAVLLDWGERELRDLPWRRTRDPWAILVAETMLQQTQVARVQDRWPALLARFPTPTACAEAPAAELLREWAGLGYNRRALMLHRAATAIRDQHEGAVPARLEDLLNLPGVGPYTARAVLAFAFEAPAAPVDTNIGRVLARLEGRRLTPTDAQRTADALVPDGGVWVWNQSLMELGALVCRPRVPACGACPVRHHCAWRGEGEDPAVGSAAVSRPQARFEGSDRQLRGRVVDALRGGPVGERVVVDAMQAPADGRAATVLAGLVADGLIERDGDRLWLAGEVSPDR